MTSIILSLFSYGIALISFVVGTYEPLWKYLKIPSELWPSLTTGFSVLILLLGHHFAIVLRDRHVEESIKKIEFSIGKISSVIEHSIVQKLGNGDDGLRYLMSKFGKVVSLRNTRIPSAGAKKYRSSLSVQYVSALENLASRGVVFREIAGAGFIDYCQTIKSKQHSTYDFAIIDPSLDSFINFTILELSDGTRELVFGWPVSSVEEFSAGCFLSKNDSLIALFETVFNEQYRKCAVRRD